MKMLGKTSVPKLCPYGCCKSYMHHGKKSNKIKRAIEKRTWKRALTVSTDG